MLVVEWVAIAVVGVLVIAELALRALSSKLRPLTTWGSWEVHNKLAAAERLAKEGGASIVTIGTSAVNASVEPGLLGTLSKRARPAFNAALNGSSPQMLELWTLRVIVPMLRPDVVVYGLDSSQVNKNNVLARRNYELFRTSQGWGERAREGRLLDRFIWFTSRHSYLVRYRTFLFKRALFEQDRLQRATSCRRLGLLRWVMVFRYRPYTIKTRQMEAWKEALNEYEIGDEELEAMGRIVDGLKAAGVVPIIAPIPYTDDWIPFHPRGDEDVQSWKRVIRQVATVHGCAYVDLRDRFTTGEQFADPVHFNGDGQLRFTRLLADEIGAVATPAAR